jgi:hypothetical protein
LRQRSLLATAITIFRELSMLHAFRFRDYGHAAYQPHAIIDGHFLRYFITLITPLFRQRLKVSPAIFRFVCAIITPRHCCHAFFRCRHTPLRFRYFHFFSAAAISPIWLSRYFDAPLADFLMPCRHTLADSFAIHWLSAFIFDFRLFRRHFIAIAIIFRH